MVWILLLSCFWLHFVSDHVYKIKLDILHVYESHLESRAWLIDYNSLCLYWYLTSYYQFVWNREACFDFTMSYVFVPASKFVYAVLLILWNNRISYTAGWISLLKYANNNWWIVDCGVDCNVLSRTQTELGNTELMCEDLLFHCQLLAYYYVRNKTMFVLTWSTIHVRSRVLLLIYSSPLQSLHYFLDPVQCMCLTHCGHMAT